MCKLDSAIGNIRYFDELAEKKTSIHEIHPAVKIFITMSYIVIVLSFEKYDLTGLIPFVFYPVILLGIAEIPFVAIFRRVLLLLPFVLGIGAFNILYDSSIHIVLYGLPVSGGIISFVALSLKGIFTMLAAFCLIGTTSIGKIAGCLRMIRIPRVFVTQLFLNYRYIGVLIDEASRIWQGYSLRAPLQKGVQLKNVGSLMGQLLIRSFDRAQRVYNAMKLRGFDGEYHTGTFEAIEFKSILYMICCFIIFITFRFAKISNIIGDFMTGVIS